LRYLRKAAAKIETSDGRVGIVTRSFERIHVSYAINLDNQFLFAELRTSPNSDPSELVF